MASKLKGVKIVSIIDGATFSSSISRIVPHESIASGLTGYKN